MVPPPADDTPPAEGQAESTGGSDTGDEEAAHGPGDGQSGDERETPPRAAESGTDEVTERAADPARDRAALLDALADPAGATRRLPYVLTQLESDEQVGPLLAELAGDRREVPLPQVGNVTRSHYYGAELGRVGVGRMQVAGADTPDDGEATADGADGGQSDGEADDSSTGRSGATAGRTREVSSIAVRSRFDELHIQAVFVIMTATSLMTATIKLRQNLATL